MLHRWESGWFHLGQFQDECFKRLTPADQASRLVGPEDNILFFNDVDVRGIRMNFQTIKCYGKAIRYGSKYIYQTVPRLLTLWLDMGEAPQDTELKREILGRVNGEVSKAIRIVPMYQVSVLHQWVSLVTEIYVVVHCVSTDSLSGWTYQQRCLHYSSEADPECDLRVSQASFVAICIRC